MKAELTRIGDSRGIRIPKPLIAQCGLGDVVELRVTPAGLVIAPHRAPRSGWTQAFACACPADDDLLLIKGQPNECDGAEWKW